MNAAWPHVHTFIEREVDSRGEWGLQLCVIVDDRVVLELASGGNGLGGTLERDTPVRVYCATKPVTAVAIAGLVERGALDLDEPVGTWLRRNEMPGCRHVTLRHVLTHTAGLHRPSALEIEILSPRQRARCLADLTPPPDWKLGIDAAFGDFVGWHLAGLAIEAVAGEPLGLYLRANVLDPLGLHDTWIGMSDDQFERHVERLGCNIDARFGSSYPILLERSPRWCREVNCGSGGYSTAQDLARFYDSIRRQLRTDDVHGLPPAQVLREFCSGTRGVVYDRVLERETDSGLGFMVDLRHDHFGASCSPASFGHSGWSGASFGFADPRCGLAVGAVRNCITAGDSGFPFRAALVESIYADLRAAGRVPEH